MTSLALAKPQVCSSEAGAVLKDSEGEEGLWKVQLSLSIDVHFEQLCVRCWFLGFAAKAIEWVDTAGQQMRLPKVKAPRAKHTDAQHRDFFLKIYIP